MHSLYNVPFSLINILQSLQITFEGSNRKNITKMKIKNTYSKKILELILELKNSKTILLDILPTKLNLLKT